MGAFEIVSAPALRESGYWPYRRYKDFQPNRRPDLPGAPERLLWPGRCHRQNRLGRNLPRCSGAGTTKSSRCCRSDLESLEKGDAFLCELHVLLDEVVLDPTDLRRRKGLDPVDAALSERYSAAPSAGCTSPGYRSRIAVIAPSCTAMYNKAAFLEAHLHEDSYFHGV